MIIIQNCIQFQLVLKLFYFLNFEFLFLMTYLKKSYVSFVSQLYVFFVDDIIKRLIYNYLSNLYIFNYLIWDMLHLGNNCDAHCFSSMRPKERGTEGMSEGAVEKPERKCDRRWLRRKRMSRRGKQWRKNCTWSLTVISMKLQGVSPLYNIKCKEKWKKEKEYKVKRRKKSLFFFNFSSYNLRYISQYLKLYETAHISHPENSFLNNFNF